RRRQRRPLVGMLVPSMPRRIAGCPTCRCRTWSSCSTTPTGGSWMPASSPRGDGVDPRGLAGRAQPLWPVLRAFHRSRQSLLPHGQGGSPPDEVQRGQVSRALKVLSIRQIFANSPEARGRSEPAFGTIQGRLPQELRVAGITTYAAANRYLEET